MPGRPGLRAQVGGAVPAARAGRPSTSASSAGTTVAGSGRSEMSSPGKASWCICVRMSPGSTAYTRSRGLLRREHPASWSRPPWRRRSRPTSRRPRPTASEVMLRTTPACRRSCGSRPAVRASGATTFTSSSRRYVVGSRSANGGSGLAPRVLALLTSRSAPPSSAATSTSRGGGRGRRRRRRRPVRPAGAPATPRPAPPRRGRRARGASRARRERGQGARAPGRRR